MRAQVLSASLATLFFSAPLGSQEAPPRYFPLDEGNFWAYQPQGTPRAGSKYR
jgi:hypothetical protein